MAQAKAHTKKPANKTSKKNKNHSIVDQIERVTITSSCLTSPQNVLLGKSSRMKIQFHCGAGQFFALKLEGGVFVGQDSPFLVYVGGPTFAPDPPLEVRSDANATMINYVFDLNGHNCPKPPKDNPPDIIIQN